MFQKVPDCLLRFLYFIKHPFINCDQISKFFHLITLFDNFSSFHISKQYLYCYLPTVVRHCIQYLFLLNDKVNFLDLVYPLRCATPLNEGSAIPIITILYVYLFKQTKLPPLLSYMSLVSTSVFREIVSFPLNKNEYVYAFLLINYLVL